MTPYEELRATGTLGSVGYAWFKKQIRRIALAKNYPPPAGHKFWTAEASADWLGGVFVRRGREYVVNLGINAVDDRSYTAIVRKAIKNEFADQAKSTEPGKLRSRLRNVLPTMGGFRDFTEEYGGAHAWTLDEFSDEVWTGDWQDLCRLPGIASVGHIEKLNEGGPTSAANKKSLADAARIVLQGAGGALADLTLARVLVKIFDLDPNEIDQYFLGDDEIAQGDNLVEVIERQIEREKGWGAENEYSAPAEWLEALALADVLMAELSDEARAGLSTLDEEALDEIGVEVRVAIKRVKATREAVLIVISKCLEMGSDE